MFAKLAFRNVRRSVKDYSIYFLTLLFGVCIFYVFNSLQGQPVMQILATGSGYAVDGILAYMKVLSVFVSVVLAGLILYANRFILRRRKKEFAIYLLLGLPQSKLSLLMLLESLFIGLLALTAGLGLGLLGAQGLSALLTWLFHLPYAELSFLFRWSSVGWTALCFGVLFLMVMALNQITVARQRLADLMTAGRRNETMKHRPLGRSVALFLTGVVFLCLAYWLLLTRGMLSIDWLYLGMLILGTLGTLFFFRGFSGFVLRLCQCNRAFYYKGLNMFTLRQWSGKIHSTYLSMSVVCLLLLLAIGATACTLGMNDAIEGITNTNAPYDLTVQTGTYYEDGRKAAALDQVLEENGLDVSGLDDSVTFTLYQNQSGEGAVRRTDYNALMQLQGLPALQEGAAPEVRDTLLYTSWGSGVGSYVWDSSGTRKEGYWVVPDEAAAGLEPTAQYFVANFPAGADPISWGSAVEQAVEQAGQEGLALYPVSRHEIYLQQLGNKVLVLFIGVYLGIVFLISAAAVLALQQMSQAADNLGQYAILRRLGAEERLRNKAVFTQVFLAFFLPLALAVVHAAVGMTAANKVISEISNGNLDTVASSFVTAGLILLVYGAYFLLTYLSSRRIAGERR